MIVLGFDTATLSTTVGLRLADGSSLQARDDPGAGEHPGHATRLLEMTRGLLADAGVAWTAIDRIAVGLGPGRFTGLRVGVATARGLAQSRSLELVGVSTLRALAEAAMTGGEEEPGTLLAVIDARRGEAFAAAYFPSDQRSGGELAFSRALRPADLRGVVEEAEGRGGGGGKQGWLAVGDGAVRFRGALEAAGVAVAPDHSPLHLVSAVAICDLGARAEPVASYEQIVPDYRRRPDAEIARETAAARPAPAAREAVGAHEGATVAGGRRAVTEPPPAPLRAERSSAVEIRRLLYTDLPDVIAIERRVFPTPWSLAMFVLELSKQTGICLAALSGQRLIGYLICSRYDTVWHVMNIAVDVDRQRMGLASALLAQLYLRVDDEDARFTLEVRRSNTVAIHLYEREGFRAAGVRRRYYQDNGEDALVMWRTPATRGGSLDDVPAPGPV